MKKAIKYLPSEVPGLTFTLFVHGQRLSQIAEFRLVREELAPVRVVATDPAQVGQIQLFEEVETEVLDGRPVDQSIPHDQRTSRIRVSVESFINKILINEKCFSICEEINQFLCKFLTIYLKLSTKRSLFSEFLGRDVVNNINLPNVSTDGAVDGRAEHVFRIERHPQQTLQSFFNFKFLFTVDLFKFYFVQNLYIYIQFI